MNIGVCYDKDIKGEFIFSPLLEMLASMHVISRPEHHLGRMNWFKSTADVIPKELMEKIKIFGSLTQEWLIIMDFCYQSPFDELDILDSLYELEKLSPYRWNAIFLTYHKRLDRNEIKNIICIMKEYYELVFANEIKFLQPFLTRVIKKEIAECKEEGLVNRLGRIHERIEVKENEIILYKNKEYHFELAKIKKIMITASTFISPHLLLYEEKGIIGLTILVEVEEKKGDVPSDLSSLFKALGDATRLKILHEMRKGPVSTQRLAQKLKLTEAGISKHLKMLHHTGLVNKHRQGNYIYYGLCKDAIDYIPYKLYEYIMR